MAAGETWLIIEGDGIVVCGENSKDKDSRDIDKIITAANSRDYSNNNSNLRFNKTLAHLHSIS